LTENLKAGLAALEEAREADRVTIGTDGALHLSAIEAWPTDGIPKRTRDLIFREIGTAQFADMIMEMDAHTGFSEVLRSRKARDANELVSLYAALIAHGTELDAKSVAAMIPQLDPAHISTAMRFLGVFVRFSELNNKDSPTPGGIAVCQDSQSYSTCLGRAKVMDNVTRIGVDLAKNMIPHKAALLE
jgi:hypothetical protein